MKLIILFTLICVVFSNYHILFIDSTDTLFDYSKINNFTIGKYSFYRIYNTTTQLNIRPDLVVVSVDVTKSTFELKVEIGKIIKSKILSNVSKNNMLIIFANCSYDKDKIKNVMNMYKNIDYIESYSYKKNIKINWIEKFWNIVISKITADQF